MRVATAGWVDTHVHWDAPEFDADREAVLRRALDAGISCTINPSVTVSGISKIQALARCSLQRQDWPRIIPAYGIHPLYVEQAGAEDLSALKTWIDTDRPIALGEIGLDGFAGTPDLRLQRQWFEDQLSLAIENDLPVIMHVRHAVEDVIQTLKRVQGRRTKSMGGIAHAFNGSEAQANQLIQMGFLLGFGGSLTYEGSTRIRRLATTLPLESLVLETDAPDMSPSWLRRERNEPAALPGIAESLARLRGISVDMLKLRVGNNLFRVFGDLERGPFHGAGAHAD